MSLGPDASMATLGDDLVLLSVSGDGQIGSANVAVRSATYAAVSAAHSAASSGHGGGGGGHH